jgi:Cu/Zn superoxide dismutase
MKKIMNIAAIATILLVFAACEKSSTMMENNSSQDEHAYKKKAVTKTFNTHSTGTMAIVYSEVNECFPYFAQSQLPGSGTGMHIGNFNIENFVCVNNQGGFESAWTGTMTAANGDQIYFYNPDPSTGFTLDEYGNATGEFDIIGGTGRFTNATGHFNTSGMLNFLNMTWDIASNGYITY